MSTVPAASALRLSSFRRVGTTAAQRGWQNRTTAVRGEEVVAKKRGFFAELQHQNQLAHKRQVQA
ncbi:MAG: hypothetical protein ACRDQZ_14975, partial [Mycobacteriales bacterium]